MNRLEKRIRAIEGRRDGNQIPVWCDDESDVEQTIAAMVADGEIEGTDRSRCVWWPYAKGARGSHESALAALT
jgi:hypothetical protein